MSKLVVWFHSLCKRGETLTSEILPRDIASTEQESAALSSFDHLSKAFSPRMPYIHLLLCKTLDCPARMHHFLYGPCGIDSARQIPAYEVAEGIIRRRVETALLGKTNDRLNLIIRGNDYKAVGPKINNVVNGLAVGICKRFNAVNLTA